MGSSIAASSRRQHGRSRSRRIPQHGCAGRSSRAAQHSSAGRAAVRTEHTAARPTASVEAARRLPPITLHTMSTSGSSRRRTTSTGRHMPHCGSRRRQGRCRRSPPETRRAHATARSTGRAESHSRASSAAAQRATQALQPSPGSGQRRICRTSSGRHTIISMQRRARARRRSITSSSSRSWSRRGRKGRSRSSQS